MFELDCQYVKLRIASDCLSVFCIWLSALPYLENGPTNAETSNQQERTNRRPEMCKGHDFSQHSVDRYTQGEDEADLNADLFNGQQANNGDPRTDQKEPTHHQRGDNRNIKDLRDTD